MLVTDREILGRRYEKRYKGCCTGGGRGLAWTGA